MGPMSPSTPRLRVLSVGGNAISAFLSWRLQATNACDVTLVWKQNYEHVAQYGISFKSKVYGNERFKPRHVIRHTDEAPSREQSYDYVILCVKALPDLYDLGEIIHSVVTPEHTCIIVNTTSTLGIESELEHRFPTNVVLSLVSGVDIAQTGPSEFDHTASSDVWVGPAIKTATIPSTIQTDMATALSITLGTGQVNCKVSKNIRQEQFERMIGPIAFHPASVLFETPNYAQLMKKVGVRQLVSGVIDELIALAKALGCSFPEDFRETTISNMVSQPESPTTMYQDFMARRPMEVETYLGSPVKLSIDTDVKIPRIETVYAMLHHLNSVNQTRGNEPTSPVVTHPPRMSSAARPGVNNVRNGGRNYPSPQSVPPPRRGGPSMGNHRPPNGLPPPRGAPPQRDAPMEDHGLEEFSHVVNYEAVAGDIPPGGHMNSLTNGGSSHADLALRERELRIRQRELQLREQELNMRRGPPSRRMSTTRDTLDDGDDGDYFDAPPPMPQIDPDNFDMMSVTSRKNRKVPSNNAGQFRKNPEMAAGRPPSAFSRAFGMGRNRTSARIVEEFPGMHDSLLDNPMIGYSSNRYGSVDRREMQAESRANSLTASRINDLSQGVGHGPYPPPSRRTSQSPGQGFRPNGRGMGRTSTGIDGFNGQPNGMGHPNRRSPPGIMRAPVPRHPGQPNGAMPQRVEQQVGVSNSNPAKRHTNVRSLTGSASASAGSGDSGASVNIDSETSAHSSQSSLPPYQTLQQPGNK
ncbi:2-dehydropantoate 2-reductase [Coccidioides immitis RS]|uniref:2-dehydropantoate 2-reductase n=1 Tax=Coccidioides immitis (strain RS) TaxID=246410 RepID=J3K0R5_COCIM|nr:2-dehydropantoate 2-reductase [Coccidioides immitis RS]EAS27462.3 2-dehydropantoate 2-reductase [Coccidioides immitis RS]